MAAASIGGEGGSAPLSSIYDDGICRQWFAKMLHLLCLQDVWSCSSNFEGFWPATVHTRSFSSNLKGSGSATNGSEAITDLFCFLREPCDLFTIWMCAWKKGIGRKYMVLSLMDERHGCELDTDRDGIQNSWENILYFYNG
uniref:Uncharacterized protein n=1 Tax=Oryza glaberrima TaxID=4538 RepID=I1QAQ3_ORYGL